jgi:preprotein translocase subunit YajC
MSDIVSLLPLVFVFVVFYAVLYLPQRRRNKKHKEFVENLKIGEDVITDSGIYGRVTSINDDTVTLVLKNGEIKIKTSFINSIS